MHVKTIFGVFLLSFTNVTFPDLALANPATTHVIIGLAKDKGLPEKNIGMVMRSIKKNETVVSINPDEHFSPASLVKVITAWAAVQKWGPSYTFKTKVHHFKKSLCVEGGGDPALVHEQVFTIAEQVSKQVKDKIATVYVDDQILPTQRDYVTGFELDKHRAFTAPISGLSLNYNSLTIQIKAGAQGEKAEVLLTPYYKDLMDISNTVKVSKTKHNPTVSLVDMGKKWRINVGGSMKPGYKQTFLRSIDSPQLYAGHAFATYYAMFTKNARPAIIHSTCPPGAKLVYTHYSKPLSEIIMLMNKFSNNMIAESLFAQLGEPFGLVEGAEYLAALAEKKIPFSPGMIIDKGSGLSRESKVTAKWFAQFFDVIGENFFLQPEIFSSLSISGMDGTLKRRTNHPSLTQHIRGKTGSLSGVTALAGIINTPQWGPCVFAMFFKHKSIPAWKVHQLEKSILKKLMEPAPKNLAGAVTLVPFETK